MKPIPMHAISRNSAQFNAISRIFNCFLFRNFSAIARNEIAQAGATIARNSAQLRATEFRLETLEKMHAKNEPKSHCFKTIVFGLFPNYVSFPIIFILSNNKMVHRLKKKLFQNTVLKRKSICKFTAF